MTKPPSSGRARRLVVAGLAASLFFIVVGVPAAQAAKRHVGVSLTGASAGTVHEAISTALRHHGFEAVPADLGSGDSDDAIAAAAKQSHLAAVIIGEVRDGGKRLKLRVYGAAGDLIGEGSWAEGGGARRLAAAVERTLWARVGGVLSKAHASGEKAEKAEKPEAEAEPAQDNEGKSSTYSHSKDVEPASGGDEGDGARKHKKHKTSEAAEEEPAGPTGAAATALDFAPSLRFLTRSLAWNPTVASLRGYTLSLAPSVGVVAAWYPAAHFRGGWPSNLGIGLNLEYTPGLQSQTSDGSRYPTSESDLEGDLRYRLILGGAGQLAFLAGGGQHAFIFHSSGTSMRSNLADLPDVQYTYVRAGVDARFTLPANLAFMVSGAYRYVIGAGNDNYLIESSAYLGKSSFVAFDVSAGVGYRFLSMLEARAGFDLRRYQISAAPGNTPGVSSATDQYTALWFRIAVLLDGVAAGEGGAAAAAPKAEPAASDEQKGADKDDKKGADE